MVYHAGLLAAKDAETAFWYEQVGGWLGAIHPLFVVPIAALAVMLPAVFFNRSE